MPVRLFAAKRRPEKKNTHKKNTHTHTQKKKPRKDPSSYGLFQLSRVEFQWKLNGEDTKLIPVIQCVRAIIIFVIEVLL